jgi:hypothetical protein
MIDRSGFTYAVFRFDFCHRGNQILRLGIHADGRALKVTCAVV